MNDDLYYQFKYIIIGDSNVGKTSILENFIYNKFNEGTVSTIGFDYQAKHLSTLNEWGQRITVALRIWDTAGQERYKSIVKAYFRDAKCIFLVFDITKRETFNNIILWLNDVINLTDDPLLFLVGNKTDKQDKREVTYSEASIFARENGMRYSETSAKLGDGINYLFTTSANDLVKKHHHQENLPNHIKLDQVKQKNYCGYCYPF